MRTAFTLAFLLLKLVLVAAQPVRVAGTSVTLAPPPGFTPSARFPGFERADFQASIMVTEVPSPMSELTRGITAAGLATRGMTLISSARQQLDGRPALLLHVSQPAAGSLFLKWMIVIGDAKASVMVVGTFPKSAESELSAAVRESVLSTRSNVAAAPDHFEGLPFRVSATPALKIAGRMSNMLLLTESGKIEPQKADAALLAIGSSVAAVKIDDLKAFSEERAVQTRQLKGIRITRGSSMMLDGTAAYELVAEGTDTATGKAVTLYQVVMPDAGGYLLMQGLVSASRSTIMVPEFRRAAATFRRITR
ncbi:hypothetical protein BH18ACI5_BH18ACI5_22510 [soil metagenome]